MEIKALTGLRGLAALSIFLFHINLRWSYVRPGFLANVIGQGAIAMSFFFVLSGFVLCYQYSGKGATYREYAINRFARIYPIYALCAALSIGGIGLTFDWTSRSAIAKSIARFGTLIASNVVVMQAWFPQFFSLWNDDGSWSISVEVFCYMLLPFMVTLLANRTRKQLALVVSLSYIAAAIPGMVYVLWPAVPFSLFYSMPIFRLPEFVLGVCSCLALGLGRPAFIGRAWMVMTGALIAYLGFFGPRMGGFISHNWIVLPSVFLTVMYLASGKNLLSTVLSSRVLVWFGKVSYCFYSFQVLMLMFLIKYYAGIVHALPVLGNNVVLLLSSFVVLLGVSALGHHCIEEPMRHLIRSRAAAKPEISRLAEA